MKSGRVADLESAAIDASASFPCHCGSPGVDGVTAAVDQPMTVHRDHRRALRRRFKRYGYLRILDIGISEADLTEVRDLLDGLFDSYHGMPRSLAHDHSLSEDPTTARLPEIIYCSQLEPRLLQTRVYEAIASLAADLLGGGSTTMAFDHALYKFPGPSAPSPWHQDSAYGCDNGLGIWLPLQATGIEDGCLRYVPFSHLHGNRLHELHTTFEGKEIWHLKDEDIEPLKPVSVPVPLGAVTAHDRKMIHGAWPNVGTDVRRAWITVFTRRTNRRRVIGRLRSLRQSGRPRADDTGPTG
jgi:hypothetical protein